MATTTVVTRTGRTLITSRLGANAGSYSEPKQLGWGTGAGTAASTDVAPFTEASESRTAGTATLATTTTTNDTYQVVGTLTASGSKTITEVFLYGTSTKPASTTMNQGGTLSSGGTSLTVTSNTGFSGLSTPFYIQIESEVLGVTAGNSGTSWTVTRGQNGSTAASHTDGQTITGGNIPSVTSVTNGDMFLHSSFTGLALSNGDSLQATIQVSVA